MFYDFTEDTTVSTAYHENLFGVGMGIHGKVRDHLLIAVTCE